MLRARFRSMSTLALALSTVYLGCSSERREDEGIPYAVVEADNPEPSASTKSSDVPVEALGSLEKVYVLLSPSSLQSLDDALADKGYGNVKSSDFKPQFETTATELGPAITAFSSADWILPSLMFQPMTVTQWLEAALADDNAAGVIINPGHAGQTLALTKSEVRDALEWLPRSEPLAMEIHVSR